MKMTSASAPLARERRSAGVGPALLAAFAFVALLVAAISPALASDGPSADELKRRVEWIRQLPPEEKARLKEALARFRALPAAERDALRNKAAKIGAERLEGLAGRDLPALRSKRKDLNAEIESVFRNIGEPRFEGVSESERAYLRSLALRRFQQHIQRRALGMTSYSQLETLTPEEKRSRMKAALERIVGERIGKMPDEERRRIEALPPKERKAEHGAILAQFRMDETLEFARVFDQQQVRRFQSLPAEKRAEEVRNWRDRNRWFAVSRILKEEIAISDEARRAFATLGPLDWARVAFRVAQTENLPPQERRVEIEREIQQLAGARTLDPGRRNQPLRPGLRYLRERRLLGDGPAPGDLPR